jgi:hypothetical protein
MRRKRVNITSFIRAEAGYFSRRCIFEELGTWPYIGGARACFAVVATPAPAAPSLGVASDESDCTKIEKQGGVTSKAVYSIFMTRDRAF